MIKIEGREDGGYELTATAESLGIILIEFSMLVDAMRDSLEEHYDLGMAVVSLKLAFEDGLKHQAVKPPTKEERKRQYNILKDALRKEAEP